MDDLHEKIEETVEIVVNIWLNVIAFFIATGLVITAPVWLVPYLIIRKIEEARE